MLNKLWIEKYTITDVNLHCLYNLVHVANFKGINFSNHLALLRQKLPLLYVYMYIILC